MHFQRKKSKESPGKEVKCQGYGRVMRRREEHYEGRWAMEIKVQGRRKREDLREDVWTK